MYDVLGKVQKFGLILGLAMLLYLCTVHRFIGRPALVKEIPRGSPYVVYLYDKAQHLAILVSDSSKDVRLVFDPDEQLLPFADGSPFVNASEGFDIGSYPFIRLDQKLLKVGEPTKRTTLDTSSMKVVKRDDTDLET